MKRLPVALFALLLLGLGLAQFTLAQSPVDMRDRTIAEVLEADADLSILNAMVEAAQLEETLSGEGPFTLFAPTDRAWVALNGRDIAMLLDDSQQLRDVLLYHVLPGELTSDRLLEMLAEDGARRSGAERAAEDDDGDPVERLLSTGVTAAVSFGTGQGSELEIVASRTSRMEDDGVVRGGGRLLGNDAPVDALRREGVDLMAGDAFVVAVDILASNGVIHLIDRVLAPEGVDLLR